MAIIEIKGLTKKFGELVADNDVSFEVNEGEVFGLLGPNGAGKSTLISMITTLLAPDSGEITINGYNIKKQQREVKKLLGLCRRKLHFIRRLPQWRTCFSGEGCTGLKARF